MKQTMVKRRQVAKGSAPASQHAPAPTESTQPMYPFMSPSSVPQLQATVGNQRVNRLIQAKRPDPGPGALKLRTALDSKVAVADNGGGQYTVAVDLEAAGECVLVADYELRATSAQLHKLPIYIEDIVTDSLALVRIQYDPAFARVNVRAADELHDMQRLRVQAIPTPIDDLSTSTAPKARDAGPGYVAEGRENVTAHAGASEIDKVMGSVASAEGGFASTEGSDQGIFTWGQGQWTVGANLLQPVLQFIKDRRPDLFDHYWGAAGLDIRGGVFYYEGRPYAGKAKLRKLFRANKAQNLMWVNLFAQAGQDPQIQRLQREYQRGEVRERLGQKIKGKAPDAWLNTRGKAFYYSMWVNLPGVAHSSFAKACAKAGKATAPTEAIKDVVSAELEDIFKQSGVTARSGDKHHYIAFWGEAGRQKAVDEADQHIADPSLDKVWTTDKWQKHKRGMEKRESRYEKTKADIDKALARQNVEPDVPADLGSYFP
jgi:hypothetical protein